MEEVAPWLWILYGAVALAFPVARQWRRSGTTGLRLTGTRPGSLKWVAETIQIVGLGLGLAGSLAAGDLAAWGALDATAADVAGLVLFLCGIAVVVISQAAMGASWRIGLDESERTALVTGGIFRLVRNPIFTALVIVLAGVVLMFPNVLAAFGLVLVVVSVELQARKVEEPHLLATHNSEYARYAAAVGRFVPGTGRLRG